MKNIRQYCIKSKILLLLIALLLPVIGSCNVSKGKTYVIGIVNPNKGLSAVVQGFIKSMETLGYYEGDNVTYIRIDSKKEMESGIREMIHKKVDLIYTLTTPATKMTKKAVSGTGIPIVFGTVFDPVKGGIVTSLRNNKDITGIQVKGATPKALELLLSIVPGIKNIYVPVSFDTKAASLSLGDLKEAADKLNVELTISEVKNKDELEKSLSSIPDNIDAIFAINSILIISNLQTIVDTAKTMKLPTGSGTGKFKSGLLITYGQDYSATGDKASRLAQKILSGLSPADLPIESTDYLLGVNLKTASALEITIEASVLRQADIVVR